MQMTFLNNFYTILRTLLFGNTKNIGELATECRGNLSYTSKVLGTLKDIDNNDIPEMWVIGSSSGNDGYNTNRFGYFYNNNESVVWDSMTYFGVGSGRTNVLMDDHELSARITSDVSIARTAATNSSGIVYNVTVRNNGDAAKTISEIGLYELVFVSSSSGKSSQKHVLVARAVLDNDVVIPSKESKTFDVSLSLALPTI